MISVDENLICSFQVLKPAEKKQKFGAGGTSYLDISSPAVTSDCMLTGTPSGYSTSFPR